MCGVIGLIFSQAREDMGLIAEELLKTLEYRGYDSTGAAIQDAGTEVDLRKDVGAPSVMAKELGIDQLSGQILAAQVRWATFGAVDKNNAQPHKVSCHTYIYGAHNGNVTNCDELKRWLTAEGHQVLSDNDGEMVVHTVEHYFAAELSKLSQSAAQDHSTRRKVMREAIRFAAAKLEGSYAAVIVDPISRCVWSIKKGSSLYFGIGEEEKGGKFGIASSDLSSVLKLTRVLVPMSEGDFVEYDGPNYQVYSLKQDTELAAALDKSPVRSRLRAKDTGLMPPFETFMDQEINAQEAACRDVIRLFSGGSEASRSIGPIIDSLAKDEKQAVESQLEALRDQYADEEIKNKFQALMDNPAFATLLGRIPQDFRLKSESSMLHQLQDKLYSAEAGLFADLLTMADTAEQRLAVQLLDAYLEREEVSEYAGSVSDFSQRVIDSLDRGGRIFLVCCGSSFHAAKSACLFFNKLACTEVIALLPGEFRGQYADNLRDGDLFVAVSQSGETKDLVDVVNQVIASGLDIGRITLVNNVNSTLAQEKSDLVIPLRCGPEIAVAATKIFINQLTVFYGLAVRLAERRLTTGHEIAGQAHSAELSQRNQRLPELPGLIRRTIEETEDSLEAAAELLYLEPSIHLLATRLLAVAKEGALKIREVVLNHTEGFEASEFKHGPNTILGINTIYGPQGVEGLLKALAEQTQKILLEGLQQGLPAEELSRLTAEITTSAFNEQGPELTKYSDEAQKLSQKYFDRSKALEAMQTDYPLVYITGPDKRDVALTVSQINTHKIRGATTVVIAEEHPELRGAAEKAPAGAEGYTSCYVALPETGDSLMPVFSATVALQRLALKMSLKKMAYLDRLELREHGVHPDVPKNVSKSITVD